MQHDDILSKRNVNPEILFFNRKVFMYTLYTYHTFVFRFIINFRSYSIFESRKNSKSNRNETEKYYIYLYYREIINSIARIGKLKS